MQFIPVVPDSLHNRKFFSGRGLVPGASLIVSVGKVDIDMHDAFI
jgi:hypothetical protein